MGTEQEVRFPNNYKITTSDASANFSLDFKLPNLEPIIKHKNGELSLVMLLEDILNPDRESAEIPLINMIKEVVQKPKNNEGDVSFG